MIRKYKGRTIEIDTAQTGDDWSMAVSIYDANAALVKTFDSAEHISFSSAAAALRTGYDLACGWIDRRNDPPSET